MTEPENEITIEDVINAYDDFDRKGASKIKGYLMTFRDGHSGFVYKNNAGQYGIIQGAEIKFFEAKIEPKIIHA